LLLTGDDAEQAVKLKPYVPRESDEQASVFAWATQFVVRFPELQLLHAIPNGALLGGRNRFAVARELTNTGLRVGVPDIHLPVPRSGLHRFGSR
jgi:hypothetical protein